MSKHQFEGLADQQSLIGNHHSIPDHAEERRDRPRVVLTKRRRAPFYGTLHPILI